MEDNLSFARAMSIFQGKVKAAKMNCTNPFLKNKYADLGSLIETAKEYLKEVGMSVVQKPYSEVDANGTFYVGVETIIFSANGDYQSSKIALPIADEKGKSTAQVLGSIISYLRRYSYASMLGLYADEDTDGSLHNEQKSEPSKLVEAAKDIMTIEKAIKMTDHEGKLYNDMPVEDIAVRYNQITKLIKDGKNANGEVIPKEKMEEYKVKASGMKTLIDYKNATQA